MGTCGLPKFLTPIRSGTSKYPDPANSFSKPLIQSILRTLKPSLSFAYLCSVDMPRVGWFTGSPAPSTRKICSGGNRGSLACFDVGLDGCDAALIPEVAQLNLIAPARHRASPCHRGAGWFQWP